MSDRDKKLLVYLGALIIVAAAYFLVGRPFLDKIDQQSTEKTQLTQELNEKRKAFENKEMYQQGIAEANEKINAIIGEFPEDNSDEKSIMFASHAEADVPIWFNQMKFAEETRSMINGEETESASDVEQQQLEENVAAAEGEGTEAGRGEGEVTPEAGESSGSAGIGDLMYRDTELGLSFETTYDGFKNLLAYIRDYEDRMVIKEIDFSYNELTGLTTGDMVLSQYAILGPDRELPAVETDVEDLGVQNIFMNRNNGGSIIDLLADVANDLLDKIMGGLTGGVEEDLDTDFFVKVNAVTDNTSGKTIGKSDDLQQTSYAISDKNDKEDVRFEVSGGGGHYTVRYSIGDSVREEGVEKDTDKSVYLRVISTERMSDSDNVSIALHIINNSDIPVTVSVEGEDENRPRVDIVEKAGDVIVR